MTSYTSNRSTLADVPIGPSGVGPDGRQHWYRGYSLAIRSELPFPELFEMHEPPQDTGADVVEIRIGSVPETLENGEWLTEYLCFTQTTCLYILPSVGRILCEGGKIVVVDRDPLAGWNDVRAYIVGGVLSTILHQRGLLPFHVSAIATPEGVWAFTGPSGAGKSTLVSRLSHATGWPIVADDVAHIRMQGGTPLIYGAVTKVKLWRDSAETLGVSAKDVVRDLARVDKFHVHWPNRFVEGPLPLVGMALIAPDPDQGERPLAGLQAFSVLHQAIFRGFLLRICQTEASAMKAISELASSIEMVEAGRTAIERHLTNRQET